MFESAVSTMEQRVDLTVPCEDCGRAILVGVENHPVCDPCIARHERDPQRAIRDMRRRRAKEAAIQRAGDRLWQAARLGES